MLQDRDGSFDPHFTQTMDIDVTEMTQAEVGLIADYWYQSSPEHLHMMGADAANLPPRDQFVEMISGQLLLPYDQKDGLALIWWLNGGAVGHCNVNNIIFGERANMHLHLWKPLFRRQGFGTRLVKKSLPIFFEKLHLTTLFCEPYALNPAPNNTLSKAGFTFVKTYRTIPGTLNFEQEVNQWTMDRDQALGLSG